MNQDNDKKYLFEEMPVNRALMKMAIPTIISQIISLIYSIVDTVFIGQTGDAYKTAAVTLVFTIFMMTVSFSNLFGVGGGSLIARLIGAGNQSKAKAVSALSFWGAIAIATLYSILVGAFLDPLLYLLGASSNTIGFAREYVIVVVVIGDIPIILSAVTAHLLRNTGFSKQAGIGLSLGGILNVILDPIFMFVILPRGREVLGAALATLFSNIAACIYLVIVMAIYTRKTALSMNPLIIRKLGRPEYRSFFGVGIPSALLTGLFDIANVCLNSLTASHGDLELAAMGIVMKAERLPNAINVGICQGMLPIVAYNYASGNHKRLRDAMNTAQKYGVGTSVASIVLFEIFSPFICKLFMNTSAGGSGAAAAAVTTIAFATIFLRIRCLASPFQFLNYNTSFAMQAVGYGSGTLLHACVRELVFYIPFMYLMNHMFGIYGLVCAILLGEGLGALFALLLFRRWRGKNSVM